MSGVALATFWNLPAADLAAHFQQRQQAEATVVVPFVRQTAVARPARRLHYTFRGFGDFMPAFRVARERAILSAGRNWWMSPDHALWARVPTAWVTWKGRASSGSSPRDLHFPLGRYWDAGELPIGPDYAPSGSVAQFANPPPRRPLTIEARAWELVSDAAD